VRRRMEARRSRSRSPPEPAAAAPLGTRGQVKLEVMDLTAPTPKMEPVARRLEAGDVQTPQRGATTPDVQFVEVKQVSFDSRLQRVPKDPSAEQEVLKARLHPDSAAPSGGVVCVLATAIPAVLAWAMLVSRSRRSG
jgi:hypothetical protein